MGKHRSRNTEEAQGHQHNGHSHIGKKACAKLARQQAIEASQARAAARKRRQEYEADALRRLAKKH